MPPNTYISSAEASANFAELLDQSKRAFSKNLGKYGDWMGDVGTSSAIGRGIGAYGVPMALKLAFPQISLPLLALSSLLGSWGGSEVGQQWEGPPPALRTPDILFGEQDISAQEQELETMLSAFDASQITDAISDMTNYFTLGGGKQFLKDTPFSFSDWFNLEGQGSSDFTNFGNIQGPGY
jgi:hypothetical protein